MNFHVLTLFPEMIDQGVRTSITGRAIEKGVISLELVNIRDYTKDKHKKVDDYPYGGGAGMLMQAQPVYDAFLSVTKNLKGRMRPRVIYMAPQGRTFHQQMARELACEEDLIILCGHYEGIDQRVRDCLIDREISIGDYVLTGGELAAMVFVDAVSRFIPGTIKAESAQGDTFESGLLEYPQYTRPQEFMGLRVPDVLLSGHHANVEKWRREQSVAITKKLRPDLLEKR